MRTALVITPFSTAPLDSKAHRRAYQTTKLIADMDFHITMVLLACEGAWRVRHQEDYFNQLSAQWDRVIVVYCDPKIGLPPCNGTRHRLDEWWDFNLENALRNLIARHSFDLCLVHQVWLSRAFELFDQSRTLKIIDVHDLLSRRAQACELSDAVADGFRPDQASELFGIDRADIVIAARESTAVELVGRSNTRVLTVPFYDAALETQASGAARPPCDRAGPVRFGFIADHGGAAAADLQTLDHALGRAVAKMPTPIQLVVAAAGSGIGEPQLPRPVLRIDSAAAFYRDVDCVIAPRFTAPELEPAGADAAALGLPLLTTAEAAEGLRLDPLLVCGSADEMAARMVEMSLSPARLAEAAAAVLALREPLRARVADGAARLRGAIARAAEPLIIDLADAALPGDGLPILSYLSYLRVLGRYRRIWLALSPEVSDLIGAYLPPAVIPLSRQALPSLIEQIGVRPILVDALGKAPPGELPPRHSCRIVRDPRWTADKPGASSLEAALGSLPFFHSDVDRVAAARELRRLTDPAAAGPAPARLVFIDATDSEAADPFAAARLVGTSLVPLADEVAFREAAMSLFESAGGVEVAWLARHGGCHQALIVQLCALRDIPLWAMLDAAAFNNGPLPRRAAAEFDRLCEQQLQLLAINEDG